MSSLKKRPIGIFDSGVGGLTVARSVRKYLPGEDVLYFGDTARVPYGNKSKDTVIRFSREITTFLLDMNVKMVVVACNTASSFCIPVLRRTFAVPVTGVIEPGVREAASLTSAGSVGVIGTRSTVKSGSYRKCMADVSSGTKVFGRSCPLFVPLVENRLIEDPVTREMAARYLSPFKRHGIDTLILGCTHYPVLKNVISSVLEDVNLVDSSQAVARSVGETLKGLGLLSGRRSGGKLRCYVSDDEEGFRKTAGIFLGRRPVVRKVNL
jgi:glutamate racemase